MKISNITEIDGRLTVKPAINPNEAVVKSQLDVATVAVGGATKNTYTASAIQASETFTLPTNLGVLLVFLNGQEINDEYTQTGDSLEVTPEVGLTIGDTIVVVQASVAESTEDYIRTIKIVSTTTYTLLEADKNKILIFTNAAGCTVTVPVGLTAGNRYEGKQRGDVEVSFVGAGGITINPTGGNQAKTRAKFSPFALDSYSATEYDLYGDLKAI